jgi:hypothetical protein
MAHHIPADPAEDKLKEQFESLLRIRRQYLKASADFKEARQTGNTLFKTFIRELKASSKPKRAKASKV